MQAGAITLGHELGHSLGLSHTFDETRSVDATLGNCIDADGIQDTPSSSCALWNIPVTNQSNNPWDHCMAIWRGAGGTPAVVYQRQAAGLGPRADELTSDYKSCANSSTRTPYAAVGDFLP